MATFFGEVTEISSRAVWWSDSDEDEEAENKFFHDFNVTNQDLFKLFLSQCKCVYVSIGKREPNLKTEVCVFQLKLGKSDTRKDLVVSLYQLSPTDYWLLFNKRALEINTLTVKLVDYIGTEIFKRIQSKYDLLLISKDLSKSNYVEYFSNNSNSNLLRLQKSIEMRPIISPETVKSQVELAILEYCIVEKVNFICFLLPSSVDLPSNLIPKQIIDSISEFTDLSFSNIIT